MKPRQLLWLALLAFVLFAAHSISSYKLRQASSSPPGQLKVGADLFFDDFRLQSLMVANEGGESTSLAESAPGQWTISSRSGFPADMAQVKRTEEGLRAIRIAQVISYEEKNLASYGLAGPGVTHLQATGADGKKADLLLGKVRQRAEESAGRYCLDVATRTLFVSEETFPSVDGSSRVWLRKFLPDSSDLLSISYFVKDAKVWQAARSNEREAFAFSYPSSLANTAKADVFKYMSQLFQIRFMDATPAIADYKREFQGERVEFTTRTGRVYRLTLLCVDQDGRSVRCALAVRGQDPLATVEDDQLFEEQQYIAEWHFLIPAQFVNILRMNANGL